MNLLIKKLLLFFCFYGFSLILSACNDDKKVAVQEITVTDGVEVINDDFNEHNPAWKSFVGEWLFKDGALIQNADNEDFPVILRQDKSFSDLVISVDFKALSGDIDASGGVIFRALDEDNYYIVRANALETNYRLYTFTDGMRSMLASATVAKPALGKFHTLRVIAKGDHIQVYLNGNLELDHHDNTFNKGFTGLWTKADSVTAFDNFKVTDLSKK